MRTEHILSEEDKEVIADIEKEIFRLQMRKADIYARAPVRYISETKEEANRMLEMAALLDKPLLNGIVKIKPYEREEREKQPQSSC